MIGTKRRNVSLSSNADDNNPFQSKKAVAESPLGGQAAVVSPSYEVETAATPSLDRRKAVRQHVRALNTEFASWVQSQLRDHPDEVWEDGVRDYLAQASDILEKFTDVVNWLKSNTGGEGKMSSSRTPSNEKKNTQLTNSKELKSGPGLSIFGMSNAKASVIPSSSTQSSFKSSTASAAASWSFGLSASTQALSQSGSTAPATLQSSGVSSDIKSVSPVKTVSFSTSPNFGVASKNQAPTSTTTASFMSSTSSGIFSNSQTPSFGGWNAGTSSSSQTAFTFGNQKSTALNDSAKEDADEDNEPEQPSSPSLKRSEEKGITVVHETKCKLYIKSTDPADKEPWKDKGTGQLFIKCQEGAGKGTKESKPIILVRNDVGRIMLNASIYPGIKANLQNKAIVIILHTMDDSGGDGKAVARTFLIRVKSEAERNKLAETIREHAPAA
ncbi:hypothetical protein SOVF_093630 [Spinacia oleracea]|uniref:Nucleoporin NUP152 n=1 Tax=Spinacia oleracea TaxID=3562 RepID=A0A9R0I884_SPIOL|nr:nucleoporin NUP152 [Spinacia oleracea]KNA15961.1 hypothetical protein SOVF_093630 [Spinacia oleracea]